LLLKPQDWDTLEKFESVLELFMQVTHVMPRAKMPTLSWVLPMYEKMNTHLMAQMNNEALSVTLWAACGAGHVKLTQYYEKAKKSQHTILATVCHPYLFTDWFHKLGPDAYKNAVTIFEHVYKEYKKTTPVIPDVPSKQPEQEEDADDILFEDIVSTSTPELLNAPTTNTPSETAHWKSNEGGHGNRNYPLTWWKVCLSPVSGSCCSHSLRVPVSCSSISGHCSDGS
ncbi:hypothetical protein OF83DRAFT_1073214, partial [Amylostereum chailletii]